jgi:hypothetical protein
MCFIRQFNASNHQMCFMRVCGRLSRNLRGQNAGTARKVPRDDARATARRSEKLIVCLPAPLPVSSSASGHHPPHTLEALPTRSISPVLGSLHSDLQVAARIGIGL